MAARWSTTVVAYDARESGYGAVCGDVDLDTIKKMHCQAERSRFKAVGYEDYLANPLTVNPNLEKTYHELWEEHPDFQEVPSAALAGEWKLFGASRCHRYEAMRIKESRASLWCLRRIGKCKALRGVRVVMFGDNLSAVLYHSKGRAQSGACLCGVEGEQQIRLQDGFSCAKL